MSIIRAILNNGFFFIVLIVATAVYLAYSDNIKRDHGILTENTASAADSEPVKNSQITAKESIDKHATPQAQELSIPSSESNNMTIASEEPAHDNQQQPTAEQATEQNGDIAETSLIQTDDTSTQADSAKVMNQQNNQAQEDIAPQESNQEKLTDSIFTAELVSMLNDQNSGTKMPQFASKEEALSAAQQASAKQEHLTAAKIYYDVITKAPSTNIVGQFALSLYQAGKTEWAEKAWLISAKMLVAENREHEAAILAARLTPISPKTAQEIQFNLQKIQQQRMADSAQKMQANQPRITQVTRENDRASMPAIPLRQPVPQMPAMPNYSQMQPMPPMRPMPPMMQPQQPYIRAPMPAMPPRQSAPQIPAMPNYSQMQPMPPMRPMPPMMQPQQPYIRAPMPAMPP
ncbi:MAG: hypothetical protein R3254_05900, partial [Thiomicrorhabdus sp.]|nr:hypothetical protein [Thiomicrorhabdus sp.]